MVSRDYWEHVLLSHPLLTSWPTLTGHLNSICHVMSKHRQHLASCSESHSKLLEFPRFFTNQIRLDAAAAAVHPGDSSLTARSLAVPWRPESNKTKAKLYYSFWLSVLIWQWSLCFEIKSDVQTNSKGAFCNLVPLWSENLCAKMFQMKTSISVFKIFWQHSLNWKDWL